MLMLTVFERTGFKLKLKVTDSINKLQLIKIQGFEASMRSIILPQLMSVGSFTKVCSLNSLIISSSLLFYAC